MADTIWGRVERVVDGDTLDLKVTHYHRSNAYHYGSSERVRLARRDAPEAGTRGGARATRALCCCVSLVGWHALPPAFHGLAAKVDFARVGTIE